MEVDDREKLLEKSNSLRQELKKWERDFASSNGGRKAERDDIKKHPSIGIMNQYIAPVNIA
jgi:DNA replication and checkpoint protein